MGWVRSVLVGILSSVGAVATASGGASSAEPSYTLADRAAPGFWKTDRAKFVDSPKFLAAIVSAHGNPESGRDKGQSNEELQEAILELLLVELSSEKGVQIETLLTVIGAIAGFSTQMAIRGYVDEGRISEKDAFVVLQTKNGETYYTGDLINEGLVEPKGNNFSVWSLVGAGPHTLGKPLPDLIPIFKRVASSYGTPEFGVPELPARHMPNSVPEELLWKYWNLARNLHVLGQHSLSSMPFVMGHLAQKVIVKNKDIIDPTLAARIVMEAAIPMSRISPDRVAYARLKAPE